MTRDDDVFSENCSVKAHKKSLLHTSKESEITGMSSKKILIQKVKLK